ncbi:hypothetical protein C5S39_02035 [Candidatus Methanophagaceae archaeon]|nr:hypothetical protein C5S39_02035 [Methanophagales archaeon]
MVRRGEKAVYSSRVPRNLFEYGMAGASHINGGNI